MFILLSGSKESPYAKNAISSLLSQPRLYLGGSAFKEGVLHHLRFSIEYLRRQAMLDAAGSPLNFAGCVSHLYFTENSSFAFQALLKDGFFHKLTANLNKENEENILRRLMLTMSHLFGRRPCRQAELEPEYHKNRVHRSPSVVFLPPMPDGAEEILKEHNNQTLQIFSTYVKTFAEQHLKGEVDNHMPLTNTTFGGKKPSSTSQNSLLPSRPASAVRSAFVALSGHGDTFESISDLCENVRAGVFLEEAAIPHIKIYPTESPVPLNAYLYDFFRHGDTTALEKANGVRKSDVWYLLNDFSLVLATIITSFRNFMHLDEGAEMDMTIVKGGGEANEEKTLDERFAALEEGMDKGNAGDNADTGVKENSKPPVAVGLKGKKKAVAESWDDAGGADSSASETALGLSDDDTVGGTEVSSRTSVTGDGYRTPAWQENGAAGNEGLLKVLKAFERLRVEFDTKFKAMWA